MHYWMNMNVDLLLSYGIRPVITTCNQKIRSSPVLVLYDDYSEPILMINKATTDNEIWNSIHNMISHKLIVKAMHADTFDPARLSQSLVVAIIPDTFYIDNVLRYQKWMQDNRKTDTDYFFIHESLNETPTGGFLKLFGHFKHLPNDSKMRIVFISRKPTLSMHSIIL